MSNKLTDKLDILTDCVITQVIPLRDGVVSIYFQAPDGADILAGRLLVECGQINYHQETDYRTAQQNPPHQFSIPQDTVPNPS